MAAFPPLLDILAQVAGPRRAEGKPCKLPPVLLFSILAIVSGCNACRGIVPFIDARRHRLNAAFCPQWRRAPAHTAIRRVLQGLGSGRDRGGVPRACEPVAGGVPDPWRKQHRARRPDPARQLRHIP